VAGRRIAKLALLLAGAIPMFALDPASLKPQGYVSDFAHVIDPASRQAAEQYCSRFEQATGVQMALVTIDSLDDAPIEDFANNLFRKWGIGHKGENDGLMLLLAIKDHKSRVEVGYGLEPILPDGFAGDVAVDMRPLLRQGQYGTAMLQAAESMGSRVARAKRVSLDFDMQRPPATAVHHGPPVLVALLLYFSAMGGFAVLLIWYMRRLARKTGGPRITRGTSYVATSSSSDWSSSSSSDSGSSGDFGGFSGGDSGGGGASSDW